MIKQGPIYYINPNSTEAMTEHIVCSAKKVLGDDITVIGETCHGAPPAIQGPADAVAAKPILFKKLEDAANSGAKMAVIACFDDPFLNEARENFPMPIIGIGGSAFYMCSMFPENFGIITTVADAVPVIEKNLESHGLANRCDIVLASEIPVLEFEKNPIDAQFRMENLLRTLLEEKKLGSLALGCAGMSYLAGPLTKKFGLQCIDGVVASALLSKSMFNLPKE